VHIDNQPAMAIASRQMVKTLTKHIRLRYHWVREQIAEGIVFLVYIESKCNWADAMTKIQTRVLFDAFMQKFFTAAKQICSAKSSR
jgi:hypothetical protein